jgi:splicing factor 3B subunit 2
LKDVEVEYVAPTPELLGITNSKAEGFEDFAKIFSKFALPLPGEDESSNDADQQNNEQEQSSGEDSDLEIEEETPEDRVNRKKMKKASRISVAELKKLVAKPDCVDVYVVLLFLNLSWSRRISIFIDN